MAVIGRDGEAEYGRVEADGLAVTVDGRLDSGPAGRANPGESATVQERFGGARLAFASASCCLRVLASCSFWRYVERRSPTNGSEGDLSVMEEEEEEGVKELGLYVPDAMETERDSGSSDRLLFSVLIVEIAVVVVDFVGCGETSLSNAFEWDSKIE